MSEQEKNVTEAAEQKQAAPKKERPRSILDRLYTQLDILEREQAKIASGYEGSQNPRAARTEYLAFAKQINDTAQTIINIKRGGK